MKDDEARYLIDEFNKYASWSVSHWINILPYVAILVSLFALSFSLPETDWEVAFLSDPMVRLYLPLGVILLAIGVSLVAGWKYNQETRSFEKRLLVLERSGLSTNRFLMKSRLNALSSPNPRTWRSFLRPMSATRRNRVTETDTQICVDCG